MENQNNSDRQLKLIVYLASFVIFAGIIAFCIMKVSAINPSGFNAEVFLMPLRWMKEELLIPTILIVVISLFLIVRGSMGNRFWYFFPLGIIFISAYWLVSNLLVIKLLNNLLQK